MPLSMIDTRSAGTPSSSTRYDPKRGTLPGPVSRSGSSTAMTSGEATFWPSRSANSLLWLRSSLPPAVRGAGVPARLSPTRSFTICAAAGPSKSTVALPLGATGAARNATSSRSIWRTERCISATGGKPAGSSAVKVT